MFEFNQGDEVRILESPRYGNRWEGYTGVIAGNPCVSKESLSVSYPVRIDGIVNKDGTTGRFWYYAWDLQMANEKRKEEKEMADREYNGMVMFSTVSQALDWAKKELGVTSNGLAPDAITNVIFNPPATIVFWKDGTKTIVKCGPNDIYDEETGLAMAISKKMFGNDGTFHKVFKKWLPEPEATDVEVLADFKWILSKLPNPGETVHTDGRKFYSMSDILREGMMSLYFKEHGEELEGDFSVKPYNPYLSSEQRAKLQIKEKLDFGNDKTEKE